MNKTRQSGDVKGFDKSWVKRSETRNNYFTKGKPVNQIQLAYRQHWSFIREVIGIPAKGRSLEVGCGRGSISSYFAEAGYQATLLDSSAAVIEAAKVIFHANGHSRRAEFTVGNALALPYPDRSFDVVVSMGLLEHFKDVRKVLSEQIRILKPGGTFIGYVVPGKDSVQNVFEPVNRLLAKVWKKPTSRTATQTKQPIYRSRYNSTDYHRWLRRLPVRGIHSLGVYPFPAISHSPDFPFSLMPPAFEKALVECYENFLDQRRQGTVHPWSCSEPWGQSFFIWAKKR